MPPPTQPCTDTWPDAPDESLVKWEKTLCTKDNWNPYIIYLEKFGEFSFFSLQACFFASSTFFVFFPRRYTYTKAECIGGLVTFVAPAMYWPLEESRRKSSLSPPRVCAPRFRTGVSRLSLFSLIFPSSLSLFRTLCSVFLQTFSFGARVVGKFGLTVRESPGEPCIRVIRNERWRRDQQGLHFRKIALVDWTTQGKAGVGWKNVERGWLNIVQSGWRGNVGQG